MNVLFKTDVLTFALSVKVESNFIVTSWSLTNFDVIIEYCSWHEPLKLLAVWFY